MQSLQKVFVGVLITLPLLMAPNHYHSVADAEYGGDIGSPLDVSIQQQQALLDTNIYIECAKTGTDREQYYIGNLLKLYRQHSGVFPDTMVFEIGDIDGNGLVDTLQTRTYMEDEDVHVLTRWIAFGEIVWEFDLVNPYDWISGRNPDLFDWDKRSPWIVFTTGIFEAQPKLSHPDTHRGISLQWAARSGLWDLRDRGHSVTEEEYLEYLRNYKGLLLEFGHVDPSRNLGIWYAPLRQFISYYSP